MTENNATPTNLRAYAKSVRDDAGWTLWDTPQLLDVADRIEAAATRIDVLEQQRHLLELIAIEWTAATKLNQITPHLHDAMAEASAYLNTLTPSVSDAADASDQSV